MAMVGNLQDFALSDLLHMLGRGAKTGKLSIWSPNGLYSIWLYQGRVVSAVAPDEGQHLQQMLSTFKGSSLVSERLIDKLSNLCCETSEPIGMCLKRQGLVSPMVLAQIFRQQLQTSIFCLFLLDSGHFSFATEARLPYGEMTGMSKAATEVALEGLRWLSGSDARFQDLPQADHRFFRVGEGLPMLQLSALEWSVWEQISPFKTVKEISLFLEEDLLQVRQICSRFLRMGVVERCPTWDNGQATPARSPLPLPRSEAKDSGDLPTPTAQKDRPSTSLLSRLASVLKGIRA